MIHSIQCSCGALKGVLSNPSPIRRTICYCRDCQAFAFYLKRSGEILDRQGGTDIVQTQPKYLTFSQGAANLACMRLTEKGMLRWYARCCNTPIANTMTDYKISFAGIIHNCLEHDGVQLDATVGPVNACVNSQGARSEPKPKDYGLAGMLLRLGGMMLMARITGSYKQTAFFDGGTGVPVAVPTVLSVQEHEHLMNEVRSAQ